MKLDKEVHLVETVLYWEKEVFCLKIFLRIIVLSV